MFSSVFEQNTRIIQICETTPVTLPLESMPQLKTGIEDGISHIFLKNGFYR